MKKVRKKNRKKKVVKNEKIQQKTAKTRQAESTKERINTHGTAKAAKTAVLYRKKTERDDDVNQ